ncbi:MAG TPA: transglycosylase domain-containing protein, partial [Desulfobaccales bacterium]|nr:transglycosylase domain-containing protein [Desulfobaccales bacterium]
GEILRLVPDRQGRKMVRLPDGPLPPVAVAAFVAAEDQRFWRHPGVDLVAVVRAAGQNLAAGRIVSGASTITQQLVRLADPGPRTYRRKLLEMGRSLRIERALSKEDILRCYLDQVPLGYNLVGVESAALAYFGKPAAALTVSQAALLAALAKAPGALRPKGPRHARLLVRQQWVLERMASLGLINSRDLEMARTEPLVFRGVGGTRPVFPFRAPHFVQLALRRTRAAASSPDRVYTTLDLSLQRRVEAAVHSHQDRLLKAGASQAACVVADNRSLQVLALVGSYHYGSRRQGFNNGAVAWRSPGSALKPFLYAQALDMGFSSSAVLEDVERRYRTPWGEFLPANFDRSAHGPVPFREALANSLNLSAIHLLNAVGFDSFYDTLKRLQLINHPERSPAPRRPRWERQRWRRSGWRWAGP